MTGEITGRHVALVFVAAFGVIIAVNLTLAFNAVRTFPGLEVGNSYVASQSFDRERAAQEALGWRGEVTRIDGTLRLTMTDAHGAAPASITRARLGRTTHTADDRQVDFSRSGEVWTAEVGPLEPGAWYLWLGAEAPDGTPFRRRFALWVPR